MFRNARYWLPLLAAVACLYAASLTPPLAAYVLIIAAFALLLRRGLGVARQGQPAPAA